MLKLLNNPNVLQVCSYKEFEPVIYGDGEGYEADILRAIAKLWEVDILFYPKKIYEDIWEASDREPYDVAAGGITPQPDRETLALYSTPTAFYSQSLLVRRMDYLSGQVTGYESFRESHLKIGVVKDSAGEKWGHSRAQECGMDNSIFVQYPSESELLPALHKGKIAAIARGDIGNEYQASLNQELMTIAHKNYNERICFAVGKSRGNFLKELNIAIQKVTESGKISYQHWRKNNAIFD